jgi:hypothetical protein
MLIGTQNFAQHNATYDDAIADIIPRDQYRQICAICGECTSMIVNLVDAYNARGETLAHAATISNRFVVVAFDRLSRPEELNLREVAAACFTISMKLREKMHPSLLDLAELTGRGKEEIAAAENHVLTALDWNTNISTGI